MHTRFVKKAVLALAAGFLSAMVWASPASAVIEGVSGTTFNFAAESGNILSGIGQSIYIWGFSDKDGHNHVQYPGPTLLLTEGQSVTINLENTLSVNVSMVFPGMSNVTASGLVVDGLLTKEVPPGQTGTYSFTASTPGTYYYHSGTNPALQVEMGLFGAIIVYPTGVSAGQEPGRAYTHADSAYDREYLFLLSEMNDDIHYSVRWGYPVDLTDYFPDYWFINGRNAPDTLLPPDVSQLRRQPYNCMPRMHPGERVLLRMVGIGRDMHPFHTHGNHARVIARDGMLLESSPGAGADISTEVFTITTYPGGTADAIFQWTGADLGFDVYGPGHGALQPHEDPTYHDVPIPTPIPNRELLTFGPFYSGSPYLGGAGALPPGQGGFNPTMAYTYMWHSHNEKEMTNNNVFPGGLMTLMFVEHPDVVITGINP